MILCGICWLTQSTIQLVSIYLIWSSGCISNEVPPYPTLYFKGGLWPFLAHNLNRESFSFSMTFTMCHLAGANLSGVQWDWHFNSFCNSGFQEFQLPLSFWTWTGAVCTTMQQVLFGSLNIPQRGLCVRFHHRLTKRVRGSPSLFAVALSVFTSTCPMICSFISIACDVSVACCCSWCFL